jgi:hypothetical protein
VSCLVTVLDQVEPVGDGSVPKTIQCPPGEDLGDDRPADRIQQEAVLEFALLGLELDGVGTAGSSLATANAMIPTLGSSAPKTSSWCTACSRGNCMLQHLAGHRPWTWRSDHPLASEQRRRSLVCPPRETWTESGL